MKKILLLMPYSGPWPPWMPLFVETCRGNATIDWLLLGDGGEIANRPANLHQISTTLDDLGKRISARLGIDAKLPGGYKLCDIRPAFGTVFREYLDGYDYFGFGDLDVVYGNLRKFFDPLLTHDAVSCAKHVSGCFFLLRNKESMRRLHVRLKNWRSHMEDPNWHGLDDRLVDVLTSSEARYVDLHVTPHTRDLPWRDGSFDFPLEWRWKCGELRDNEGVESPLLHFMVWKGGRWGRLHGGGQWERLEQVLHLSPLEIASGFRVNEQGFFSLNEDETLANLCTTEGHLGGYRLDGFDPGTHCPALWKWAVENLGVRSLLDVGCGLGHALQWFAGLGCDVLGVDGSPSAHRDTLAPGRVVLHDFTTGPWIPPRPFDLVWSAEFVEHVPEACVDNFLAAFASAGRYLMMTHALPGQPGHHHVNCQTSTYWIAKLQARGLRFDAELTRQARAASRSEPGLGGFFHHTGLVFRAVGATCEHQTVARRAPRFRAEHTRSVRPLSR